MTRYITLAVFILIALGGGTLIGASNIPGEWYAGLAKPSFNPPNWLFGPVWSILYIMIGIAGWRTWQRDRSGAAMKIWWAQLVLNFLWSPVFFTLHQIGLALVVIVGMWLTIVAFIALSWKPDRPAALLFLPYLAWVSFAGLLNAAILWLN